MIYEVFNNKNITSVDKEFNIIAKFEQPICAVFILEGIEIGDPSVKEAIDKVNRRISATYDGDSVEVAKRRLQRRKNVILRVKDGISYGSGDIHESLSNIRRVAKDQGGSTVLIRIKYNLSSSCIVETF